MIFPQPVVITPPTATTVSGARGTDGAGTSVNTFAQITPDTKSRVFEMFGEDVSRPHLMIAKWADRASIVENAIVTYDSRTFHVLTVNRWDAANSKYIEAAMKEVS